MNLPGYNYCGPFNSLNNGQPTNVLDEKCMVHDIAYNAYGKGAYFKFIPADAVLVREAGLIAEDEKTHPVIRRDARLVRRVFQRKEKLLSSRSKRSREALNLPTNVPRKKRRITWKTESFGNLMRYARKRTLRRRLRPRVRRYRRYRRRINKRYISRSSGSKKYTRRAVSSYLTAARALQGKRLWTNNGVFQLIVGTAGNQVYANTPQILDPSLLVTALEMLFGATRAGGTAISTSTLRKYYINRFSVELTGTNNSLDHAEVTVFYCRPRRSIPRDNNTGMDFWDTTNANDAGYMSWPSYFYGQALQYSDTIYGEAGTSTNMPSASKAHLYPYELPVWNKFINIYKVKKFFLKPGQVFRVKQKTNKMATFNPALDGTVNYMAHRKNKFMLVFLRGLPIHGKEAGETDDVDLGTPHVDCFWHLKLSAGDCLFRETYNVFKDDTGTISGVHHVPEDAVMQDFAD